MSVSNIGNHLNTLLTRNYDAEKGYKHLADKIDQKDLQSFLLTNSRQRYEFGHDIKAILPFYDTTPYKGTSIKGDAHRTWMSVKDALATNSDEAVLAEAERGEKKAIEDYQEVINQNELAEKHRRVLSNHLKSIKSSQEQIGKLKKII